MTADDVLASWKLDAELRGPHLPSQTIGLVSELQDIADAQQSRQRALPPYVILADAAEPRWVTRLRGLLGRAQ